MPSIHITMLLLVVAVALAGHVIHASRIHSEYEYEERMLTHALPPEQTPAGCQYGFTHGVFDPNFWVDLYLCDNACGPGNDLTISSSNICEDGDGCLDGQGLDPDPINICLVDGCNDDCGLQACLCPAGVDLTDVNGLCTAICSEPTPAPIEPLPTRTPTSDPTFSPTVSPTSFPTDSPSTPLPTNDPTSNPTPAPTVSPTPLPTSAPTQNPTAVPTEPPTSSPTALPTPLPPTFPPFDTPTALPTPIPPTSPPFDTPTALPTPLPPTSPPFETPIAVLTKPPTSFPTVFPTPLSPTSPAPTPGSVTTVPPFSLPPVVTAPPISLPPFEGTLPPFGGKTLPPFGGGTLPPFGGGTLQPATIPSISLPPALTRPPIPVFTQPPIDLPPIIPPSATLPPAVTRPPIDVPPVVTPLPVAAPSVPPVTPPPITPTVLRTALPNFFITYFVDDAAANANGLTVNQIEEPSEEDNGILQNNTNIFYRRRFGESDRRRALSSAGFNFALERVLGVLHQNFEDELAHHSSNRFLQSLSFDFLDISVGIISTPKVDFLNNSIFVEWGGDVEYTTPDGQELSSDDLFQILLDADYDLYVTDFVNPIVDSPYEDVSSVIAGRITQAAPSPGPTPGLPAPTTLTLAPFSRPEVPPINFGILKALAIAKAVKKKKEEMGGDGGKGDDGGQGDDGGKGDDGKGDDGGKGVDGKGDADDGKGDADDGKGGAGKGDADDGKGDADDGKGDADDGKGDSGDGGKGSSASAVQTIASRFSGFG